MIVVFGGAYQGKLDYVKARWGYGDGDVTDCSGLSGLQDPSLFDKKIIYHFDRLVLQAVRDGTDITKFLEDHEEELQDKVVITEDISQGVVPVDASARQWREANGRAMNFLSRRAEETVRVFCGLGATLQFRMSRKEPMKSKIVLVRHGLTEGNLKHWFYGGIDIPLAEAGRQQLRERREAGVYPYVPADAQVFTSGLIRTEETLELTYGKRQHGVIPELREFNFGEYEARTYDELTAVGGEEKEVFDRWAYDESGESHLPGGESRNSFAARISRGVEILLQAHRDYIREWEVQKPEKPGQAAEARTSAAASAGTSGNGSGGTDSCADSEERPTTLVVCHGGVISQMLIDMFDHLSGTLWDFVPAPGLGYVVELEDGVPQRFEKFGDEPGPGEKERDPEQEEKESGK